VPDSVLVLPSHRVVSQCTRACMNFGHHESSLERLLGLLAEPRRVIDTFDVMYGRAFADPLHTTFATGESIAHLNYLLRRDRIAVRRDEHGVDWYQRN
jgi:hypothetical protein